MKTPTFIVFLCVVSSIALTAQNQNTKFEYLTINEGLSSNRIYCIYRDSRDYLWIATELGLDRYDSDRIKSYRFINADSRTISNNSVKTIYEQSNGNLWFGTDNGLNLYDRKTDSFKRFYHFQTDTNSLNSNAVKSIIEDKNHVLWVLTDGDCLNRWNPESENFS